MGRRDKRRKRNRHELLSVKTLSDKSVLGVQEKSVQERNLILKEQDIILLDTNVITTSRYNFPFTEHIYNCVDYNSINRVVMYEVSASLEVAGQFFESDKVYVVPKVIEELDRLTEVLCDSRRYFESVRKRRGKKFNAYSKRKSFLELINSAETLREKLVSHVYVPDSQSRLDNFKDLLCNLKWLTRVNQDVSQVTADEELVATAYYCSIFGSSCRVGVVSEDLDILKLMFGFYQVCTTKVLYDYYRKRFEDIIEKSPITLYRPSTKMSLDLVSLNSCNTFCFPNYVKQCLERKGNMVIVNSLREKIELMLTNFLWEQVF